MELHNQTYVAEVVIPTAVYCDSAVRKYLARPGFFGIQRGYWKMHYETDHLGTPEPRGLCLTIEFFAIHLQDAEDRCLSVARLINETVSFYAGAPTSTPQIRRIAQVSLDGWIVEQHVYFYENPLPLPRIEIQPADLEMHLNRVANLETSTRDNTRTAIRWYGAAVSFQDPLDTYLATWIGLEALGPVMNDLFHPNGERAYCQDCDNTVGEKRRGALAGIQHMIRIFQPDLLVSRSVGDLESLRHGIAHALEPASDIRFTVSPLCDPMRNTLMRTILSALRPAGGEPEDWVAGRPRDYEIRPESRASVTFKGTMALYKPYLDDWLRCEHSYKNERSRLNPDGSYTWGAGVGIYWSGSKEIPDSESLYVRFERQGHGFRDVQMADAEKKLPEIPIVPWR